MKQKNANPSEISRILRQRMRSSPLDIRINYSTFPKLSKRKYKLTIPVDLQDTVKKQLKMHFDLTGECGDSVSCDCIQHFKKNFKNAFPEMVLNEQMWAEIFRKNNVVVSRINSSGKTKIKFNGKFKHTYFGIKAKK